MTGAIGDLTLDEVAGRARRILDEVERAVVGKRDALELALCALLADGHVLIEDNPGLAKTLLARSLATVTGARFSRVQFTPDLMPSRRGDVRPGRPGNARGVLRSRRRRAGRHR